MRAHGASLLQSAAMGLGGGSVGHGSAAQSHETSPYGSARSSPGPQQQQHGGNGSALSLLNGHGRLEVS